MVFLDEDPAPRTAASGGAFMIAQIMQSESEVLNSEPVRSRALAMIGPQAVLGDEASESATDQAMKTMRNSFSVSRPPNSAVLTASYESPSAERSAFVLNAIVDSYLIYRDDLLIQSGVAGLQLRRAQADEALETAQSELDAFLSRNGLTDYTTDRTAAETAVTERQSVLRTARENWESATAGAGALRTRLANIPSQIELYVENGVSGALVELQAERARLLSRYQPGAPAVAAVDREIEALRALMNSGAIAGQGNFRTGPNPVRQALETDLATRDANVQLEAQRITTLEQQVRASRNEVARLRDIEPEFTRLFQRVQAASEASQALANQEAVAVAQSSGAGRADSVRTFERATPPLEGRSMKKLGLIASFVVAAGIALFLGLIRGYWRAYIGAGRMAVPGRPQMPAQQHSGAELVDLPILARVHDRAS